MLITSRQVDELVAALSDLSGLDRELLDALPGVLNVAI